MPGVQIKTLRHSIEEKLDEIGLESFEFTNVTVEWMSGKDAWIVKAELHPKGLQ